MAATGGVQPGRCHCAAARLEIRGLPTEGASEVSFPFDPSMLKLGPAKLPKARIRPHDH
jgi:hypothetical protein